MPTWYLTHNRCSVNHSSQQKGTRGRITGGTLLPGTEPGGCLQLKPKATAASYRAACFCGELRRLTSRSASCICEPFSSRQQSGNPQWSSMGGLFPAVCGEREQTAESHLFLDFSEMEQDPTVLAPPPAPSGPLPVFCGRI